MALCTWFWQMSHFCLLNSKIVSKPSNINCDQLLIRVLCLEVTLSDQLHCHSNNLKKEYTKSHTIHFNAHPISLGQATRIHNWIESANVSKAHTILWEWIREESMPGLGAEQLPPVGLRAGNKSQVLETNVLWKPSLISTPHQTGSPTVGAAA